MMVSHVFGRTIISANIAPINGRNQINGSRKGSAAPPQKIEANTLPSTSTMNEKTASKVVHFEVTADTLAEERIERGFLQARPLPRLLDQFFIITVLVRTNIVSNTTA